MIKQPSIMIAAVAVALVCGFFIGQRFPTPHTLSNDALNSHNNSESSDAKIARLSQQLQQLTQSEIEDYLATQDRLQQMKKGEEILAKIMTLFVADLGLRLSPKQIEKIAQAPVPTTHSVEGLRPSSTLEPKRERTSPHPEDDNSNNWKMAEAQIPQLSSEKELAGFLESVAPQNLFSALRSATPLKRSALSFLQGRFRGTVNYLDLKTRPHDLVFELENITDSEPLTAKSQIQLWRDGNLESNTSGTGTLTDDFQSMEGSSPGVLVRSSPSTYMQLYWLESLRVLSGNFYRKEKPDIFTRVGSVHLEKR